MLRSTELNTFGMTNTIYLELLCRATGAIYRLKWFPYFSKDSHLLHLAFFSMETQETYTQPGGTKMLFFEYLYIYPLLLV